MKNIKSYLVCLPFLLMSFFSCTKPRIEMNMAQWGNHSSITNIQLFKLETVDGVKLEEFYLDGTTLTGTRQIIISVGTAVVDPTARTVTVKLKPGETFTSIGLLIYHDGKKVEPMNGAPRAGLTNDLSKGPYTYRVHSANGEFTDWIITLKQ